MKNVIFSSLIIAVLVGGLTYLLYPTSTMEKRIEHQIRSVVKTKATDKEDRQKEILQKLESVEEVVLELYQVGVAPVGTNDRCVCGAD